MLPLHLQQVPSPVHRYPKPSLPSIITHPDQMHPPQSPPKDSSDDGLPTTSDFVKKLYKMLEDHTCTHVVSWGPQGDCFVVKDMNEFTKSILPRMFKHSNFASFVRQLNKYDFHKVKNTDDGEHSWTFRHPDFHADRRDSLENIKRKVPAQRKSTNGTSRPTVNAPGSPHSSSATVESLQAQIEQMGQSNEEMMSRVQTLERNYYNVLSEMVGFQKVVVRQDRAMRELITSIQEMRNERGRVDGAGNRDMDMSSQDSFVSLQGSEGLVDSYPELSGTRASFAQMDRASQQANLAGFGTSDSVRIDAGVTPNRLSNDNSRIMGPSGLVIPEGSENVANPPPPLETQVREDGSMFTNPSASTSSIQDPKLWTNIEGEVDGRNESDARSLYSLGPLSRKAPSEGENATWSFETNSLSLGSDAFPGWELTISPGTEDGYVPSSSRAFATPTPSSSSQTLRVRRSNCVPGWTVPPRVLLVDDDAVNRNLSSKNLKVFGCSIDVAVDGVGAVQKMNLQKYDLVFMDIMMPQLDGMTATTIIRQFDPRTPIISMTCNSEPDEIVSYFNSGMNDILPKPFTKEGLFQMLKKHLVPHSLGVPDADALTFRTANINEITNDEALEEGERIGPLAGMALIEPYGVLQHLDAASGEKRLLLSSSNEEREPKRRRFDEAN